MIIYVDIDGTICTRPVEAELDYNASIPIAERIQKINALYREGHTVVYWTARGSSGVGKKNHFRLTYRQLRHWGCLFDELRMGKPIFDLFIDDKAMQSETFFTKAEGRVPPLSG